MKNYFKFLVPLFIIISITSTVGKAIVEEPNENKTQIQQIDRLENIKKKGALTVLSANEEPFSYKDSKTDAFRGFDADIIREVARRLGINRVDVKYTMFPNVLEELIKNSDIDLLAQGIYVTDERKKLVNFTNPIYTEREAILTRKDSGIKDKNNLKNAIIGALGGSVYTSIGDNWKKQGLIKDVMSFYDEKSLVLALENRTIDAVLTDSMVGENIILSKLNLNIGVLSPSQHKPEIDFSVGYPMKKEDVTLLNAVNEKLQEMKEDGTIYDILAKYGFAGHYIS